MEEWGMGTGMNNEATGGGGVRATRKSRRHRGSEFLAFEFLFLSRLEVGGRLEYRSAGKNA